MRSRIDKSGYTHLCQVKSGGREGNGLTGVIFACTINRAVKDTEARFLGVEIKSIHDDMTLLSPAVTCFGTANQEGAPAYLTQRWEDRRLTINENKYHFLGTSGEARAIIPEKYAEHQPYTIITDPTTRLETKAYGIKI
jgi:hypothetical protein